MSSAAPAASEASATVVGGSSSSSSSSSAAARKKKARLASAARLLARSLELVDEEKAGWTILSTPARGRCAHATRLLPEGTTVVSEIGMWVLRGGASGDKPERCGHCCRNLPDTAVQPSCCERVIYCTTACAEAALPVHVFVCPLLPSLSSIAASTQCDADLLHLVVTIVAAACLEQREAQSQQQQDQEEPTSKLGQHAGKARWVHVLDLVSHLDTCDPAWVAAVRAGMMAVHALFTTVATGPGLILPDVSTLVSLCASINSNSHAIFDNYSGSNSVVGLGLFPTTSILNHSCAPNCFFSATGRGGAMIVRTLRPIAEGEELTVPYIDLYQPRFDRSSELLKDKHFLCGCERCKVETQPPTAKQPSVFSPEQIQSWLQVGGVYCPACRKAKDQALANWDDEGADDGGKKKRKKKTKAKDSAAAATIEPGMAAASLGDAAASSSSAASSSAISSSISSEPASCTIPLGSLPVDIGLVVWRGGGADEVRLPAGTPGSTKSWQCLRPTCGARFTGSEIDALEAPLGSLYETALRAKAARRLEDALVALETLMTKAEDIIPPLHVMHMLSLTPALNWSIALGRLDQVDLMLRRILARMARVFPTNLPERSDFLVALAENAQARADKCKTADQAQQRAEHEAQASDAYRLAHSIRLVACGQEHPRTLAIPEQYRSGGNSSTKQ